MQTIEQQLEELDVDVKKIEVTDDEIEYWLENKVTRRFMLETQCAMLVALKPFDYEGPTESVGETALRFNFSKGIVEAFELVIKWGPGSYADNE